LTNLSPDRPAWRQRITRERVLVAVPTVLGLMLAAGLFTLIGWPALDRLDQQRQRIAELESKRDSLPLLDAQLKQSNKALAELMQQQALLVDLVAGRGEIQTFLAQLSRLSAASGVVINRYEPVPPSPVTASNRRSTKTRQRKPAESATASNDPLQALGYEKSSVLLQVEGPYQGLLQFLRRMELLELLVQPSDLELNALDAPSPAAAEDQSVTTGPPLTRLKLRLTFFDQASKDANGSVRDTKSSEMDDRRPTPPS
jgi:type IV pilus assembly protein PilO